MAGADLYTNVRVDGRNYPKLHAIVADCARILDVTMPEVFIDYSAFYNAYTAGVRRTFVVINSSVVDEFSEPELRYIIGHELGHIKSGHVLYHSIGRALFRYSQIIFQMFPAAQLIFVPLAVAYYEWVRRSEFSCDRRRAALRAGCGRELTRCRCWPAAAHGSGARPISRR